MKVSIKMGEYSDYYEKDGVITKATTTEPMKNSIPETSDMQKANVLLDYTNAQEHIIRELYRLTDDDIAILSVMAKNLVRIVDLHKAYRKEG